MADIIGNARRVSAPGRRGGGTGGKGQPQLPPLGLRRPTRPDWLRTLPVGLPVPVTGPIRVEPRPPSPVVLPRTRLGVEEGRFPSGLTRSYARTTTYRPPAGQDFASIPLPRKPFQPPSVGPRTLRRGVLP
jgi:hypothetical protein